MVPFDDKSPWRPLACGLRRLTTATERNGMTRIVGTDRRVRRTDNETGSKAYEKQVNAWMKRLPLSVRRFEVAG